MNELTRGIMSSDADAFVGRALPCNVGARVSMSEPSVYTRFSGMNFGVHGCGTGEEPVKSGGTIPVVSVTGGSLSSYGNSCVDVYPPPAVCQMSMGGSQLDVCNPS